MTTPQKAVKIKITVVKRLNRDLILGGADPGCSCKGEPVCPLFEEGQEFLADYTAAPEGFCAGAWADLFGYICGLQAGANYAWVNEPGKALVCCNDGFRPVIFRLERVDNEAS